jgi:protein quaking
VLVGLQEELNRGKPNWEHLNDELHVLITVEDTENRATMKMQRAIEEVKKLLVPVVSGFQLSAGFGWHPFSA